MAQRGQRHPLLGARVAAAGQAGERRRVSFRLRSDCHYGSFGGVGSHWQHWQHWRSLAGVGGGLDRPADARLQRRCPGTSLFSLCLSHAPPACSYIRSCCQQRPQTHTHTPAPPACQTPTSVADLALASSLLGSLSPRPATRVPSECPGVFRGSASLFAPWLHPFLLYRASYTAGCSALHRPVSIAPPLSSSLHDLILHEPGGTAKQLCRIRGICAVGQSSSPGRRI